MPTGDAVQSRPTLDQEMAKFKGFSTTNGEVSDGAQTDEETQRLAEQAAQEARDKVLARKNVPHANALENQQQQGQQPAQQQQSQQSTAEGDAEDDDETGEGEQQQQGQKPNKLTAEQRIKQAVARQRRAERERDSERARHASDMASMSARLAALETGGRSQPQQQTQEPAGKPDASKFELGELDPKYIDALTDWKLEQKLQARDQRSRQQTMTREQAESARQFEKAKADVTERGTAKYEDFDDVVLQGAYNKDSNPGGWVMSETLGKLALTSPVGEDVLYHLATHPKESVEVYGKSPMEQAAYFGRLESRFSPAAGADDKSQQSQQQGTTPQQQSQQQQVRTPKAPPPPQNRGRGAGAKTSVSADTTDFAAFERLAMGRSK